MRISSSEPVADDAALLQAFQASLIKRDLVRTSYRVGLSARPQTIPRLARLDLRELDGIVGTGRDGGFGELSPTWFGSNIGTKTLREFSLSY